MTLEFGRGSTSRGGARARKHRTSKPRQAGLLLSFFLLFPTPLSFLWETSLLPFLLPFARTDTLQQTAIAQDALGR